MIATPILRLSSLLLLLGTLSLPAGTVFSDDFSTSTLNSPSPGAPMPTATAYQLFSSKPWNPAPSIAGGDLRFGIGVTTSGHIEAQALFVSSPVTLATVGDYLELTVTFTNTSGLLTQGGHVGFGLYNSGGVAPLAGGMNATAVTTTPGISGGAQEWRGYVSRLAFFTNNGTHRIATRPAQSSTTGNNQDLVTEGSASQSYTGAVSLASIPSTLAQAAGSQLTEGFRITLSAANTFQIESRLYLGSNTNGTLLFSQTATGVTGANFLTNSFDAFAIGWRAMANTAATLIDIQSVTINSSVPGGGASNSVAGVYFQQEPAPAIAGAVLAPSVTVIATNSAGSPVTNTAVSLSLASGTDPLSGTLTRTTDAGGVATFNDLSLTAAGSKQLRAVCGGFMVASATFTISPAPAAALAYSVQPSNVLTNTAILPAPAVQVRDAYGNSVATNGLLVLMTLANGTGNLTGTTSASTDASGLAAFADLRFTAAGAKQITATSSPLSSATSVSFDVTNLATQIPAFPGAEGAGAYALGGRGGDVYYVTTLADSGAGSLRNGISGTPSTGRTICFKVSGNIALSSTLTVNKPRITIAGQTAPGDGVCIQNCSFNIGASDVVVRHLRTRLGTNALQEADSMWINSGTNIVVDHVSASWSVDEALSATANAANVTVQWCYIAESLNNSIHSKGAHGYGSLITPAVSTTYSWHHNLYAHNNSRNPRPGSDNASTFVFDFRNNAIYNYGNRAGYGSDWDPDPEYLRMNYIANYIVAGPNSAYNYAYQGGGTNTLIFQATNYIDLNLNARFDGANNNWSMFSGTYVQTNTPFGAPVPATDPAPVALQRVLAQAGAMPWRRDPADQRITSTVRNHNGQIIDATAQVGHWPTLVATTAPADTDSDGMPDYWELALGLNPGNAADRNATDASGYTMLENYLNWLANPHALCPRNGQVDISLRDVNGGTTNLTFTVADGTNGSAVLLPDGFTARLTPSPNFSGLAKLMFTATDPANSVGFGPAGIGVLVTTTNANTAPVLAPIASPALVAGSTLAFMCSATDTDTPPQTVTFALQDGPAGATLSMDTGAFNWRPAIAQSSTTNTMSVIATDNGANRLSATQSFTVTILQPAQPTLQPEAPGSGQFGFAVNGNVGPDYTIQASTNFVIWTDLFATNSPALPFIWNDPETDEFHLRFYRVLLGP